MSNERKPLRAGAAKADITPHDLSGLTNLWKRPFTGVHDPIFLRALVVDNGANCAAIVAADLLECGDTSAVRERIAQEIGIPTHHIIITASHAHNTPRVGVVSAGASAQVGGPATAAYTQFVYDQMVDVVRRAKTALEPVRVGVGAGTADVNTNRAEYTTQGWKLGVNPHGPSDKTVWVVKFETLDGKPLAVLINYAVHAVVLGPDNEFVTGDLPGAAERYVEQYYADPVVALWTIGAAGDQNPKYMAWDTTFTQQDREPGYPLMEALGRIVGEEVVRVVDRMQHMTDRVRIAAEERTVACPAQKTGQPHGGAEGEQADALTLRLGLILLNHIAITSVSGEVSTNIYYHLKKDSPFTNTMMITMANDRIGYIIDDAAYDTPTFETTRTPLARGYAESAIVHGLVEMINQY